MAKKSRALKHEQCGSYAELAALPNPARLRIAFVPALGALLLLAQRQKGAALSASEVERIRGRAPAIALRAAQVAALRKERGYDDVDPLRVYESWCEFQSE